jgi:hypothetical protein
LSNELFYEIFDYLDGCNIYNAFFNLNYRFQHLITSSSFPLKIQFRSKRTIELVQICQNVITPNRHRILSLNLENESLINDFFKYCIIDSSFNHLQSIILRGLDTKNSVMPLFYLTSLPHLFSLTIYIDAQGDCDLRNIYRMIFSFPSLKYNKVSLFSCPIVEHTNTFIPVAINEKFSTIEYLIINYRCNLDDIFYMLYHTPRLRHLTCRKLLESLNDFRNANPIMLCNLTHIYIDIVDTCFTDCEMFFKKLFAPVQVLHIKYREDRDYLDADDWGRLIKTYIPYLSRFDYEYQANYPCDNDDILFFMKINQFTSPFWIERQWFFEFTMHIDKEHFNGSIHPYRYIH